MRALGHSLVLLTMFGAACACSAFDPNVGPLQSDAAAASTCALGASGYGTSYGSPSGASATRDFCTPDGGTLAGACDLCEATNCCTQRVACYSDQTCSCADTSLDACLSSIPDASSGASACWSSFAATGSIATTRFACLKMWCAAACPLPG